MTDRLFHFTDEKSNKFWRITLESNRHTVTFGRIGTAGQTQTKEFGSDALAKSSYDKLVNEKVSKGYVEVPVDAAAPAPVPAEGRAETRPGFIDLEPDDWRQATWRNIPPLPKPEVPPFDRDDALRRLESVVADGWGWYWSPAEISPVLSRAEAEFWLRAIAASHRGTTPAEVAASMVWDPLMITLPELADVLNERVGRVPPEIVVPIASLFGLDGVIDLMLSDASAKWRRNLFNGARSLLLPWLDGDETALIREKIRRAFPPPSQWPTDYHTDPPPAFHLAAMFGLHDEVRRVVESWPDDLYSGSNWRPQEMVFGLDSAREVEAQMRRLKLRLKIPAHVRAWLAHTETSALEYVRDSILDGGLYEAVLLDALALVHAPQAAPVMLELVLTLRTAKRALAWIHANPEHTAIGLLPVAAGRGTMADEAIEILRWLKRRGFEALMREESERLAPDVRERIRARILDRAEKTELDAQSAPAWLRNIAPKKKAPAWVTPDELPAITLGDSMLNPEQKAAVLDALRGSKLGQSQPLVSALREHTDRDSLDRFAWRLFELWLMHGGEAKDNWAMMAVGLLGSDVSAMKLTPLIRVWPGESQHARAVLGLECLRAIGSDTALMQINGIAQKVQFKGIKAKAAECMERIAVDRGLTRAELEDRIVPDCDLDERGSRTFDFGPRQFTFALGQDMKPLVRDESGSTKPDLPKPTAKDDPDKSATAIAGWKMLKKQIAEVAKIQAVRLEQAMVTGRHWSGEEFDLLLAKHPLMTNLVRLLVWGVYEDGRLAATFRVTEDQTLADSQDRAFTLAPGARVGIAHPLQMSDAEKNAWGELLTDYEIIPPFPQLGRPVYALEKGERNENEITRFEGVVIPPQTLVYTLEKLGWARGAAGDGGVYEEHSKPFYGANVTAIVNYPGIQHGFMDQPEEEQSIERCFFVPGIYTPRAFEHHTELLPLASVDPIVISEVLADLFHVVWKAQ